MHHRFSAGFKALFCLFFSFQVFAGGTQDGGGGSEEAKMFMKTARGKVMLLVGNPKTSAFGLQLLETIEAGPKINLVPSLDKVCDGKALSSHYAYSCVGVINLLKSTWADKKNGGRGWVENADNADDHWADILHELARASDRKSRKFVTNDEGFTETTKPEVIETVLRGSRMNIDLVTPSFESMRSGLDLYLRTIATFGLADRAIETKWQKVIKTSWWTLKNDESQAKVTAVSELHSLVSSHYSSRISPIIEFVHLKRCETDSPRDKISPQFTTNTVSDSFGNYYRRRANLRTVYCAEDADYLKAIVRLDAKRRIADQDLLQFLVGHHIQSVTDDLKGALQEFVKGLNAIEINPVISKNRFGSFGIHSSAEVQMWMDFYVAKVRLALAFVKFVDRLNLGFEIKGLMYELRQQAIGALRKLNQFEDPAIFIVQIDYENDQKPTISPVFELSQLRALVQAADVGLPEKGTTVIKNRSRVEAAGYTALLTTQLRCDEVFTRMISESVPQRIIDGLNEFRAAATFIFRNCADRFIMKEYKEFEEVVSDHRASQDETRESGRRAAVAKLSRKPVIQDCAAYEVLSNSYGRTNVEGAYVGQGVAIMRWICPRPSTNLK